MSSFAESSFLFALYFPNEDSAIANGFATRSQELLKLSSFVAYEFDSAVWHDVFHRENGNRHAIDRDMAYVGLASYELDLETKILQIAPVDSEAMLDEAFRLTSF